MAADRAQLERALVNADAAGDTSAARALAAEIRKFDTPKSTMPKMAQDPKSGAYAMGSLEAPKLDILSALATGAGKATDDIGAGIKQLFGFATGGNKELDQRQQFMEAAYNPVRKANPVATSIGESAPEIVASSVLTGGAGFLPAVAGGAFGAAIPSALKYTADTPTLEDSLMTRGGRAITSGAVGGMGGGLGYAAARTLRPVSSMISGASDDALAAARRVGYNPSAGEATQSPLLQNLESYFARSPGTSGRMQSFREANQRALNRSAAGAMGESADELSEGVLKSAKGRIGSEYDRLNALASPDAGSNQVMKALMGMDGANKARGAFKVAEVDSLVEKGLDLAASGRLTGEAYQAIRSDLGAQAAATNNATVSGALKSLQKALDEAADASMPAGEQAALAKVRKQYAAFKALTNGKVIEGGNVSAARLASELPRRGNRTAYKTGDMNSDLMDIARIGESFKPPANPNSGSLMMTEAFAGKPIASAALGAVNYLPGSIYMSPAFQAYLKNKALPPLLEQGLIRGGAPAGLIGLGTVER